MDTFYSGERRTRQKISWLILYCVNRQCIITLWKSEECCNQRLPNDDYDDEFPSLPSTRESNDRREILKEILEE